MARANDKQIKGQMSLFDFIQEDEPDIDFVTEAKQYVLERAYNRTIRWCKSQGINWHDLPSQERIEVAKKSNNNSGGGRGYYIWNCRLSGIDIDFDEPIGKVTALHVGWPIFDKYFQKVCKHSNHNCNRHELWKVADSLDEVICPQVCCRECAQLLCGVRCNGSDEPQEVDVRGYLDDGYCPKCGICLDDEIRRCPECNTLLSWKNWRKINGKSKKV